MQIETELKSQIADLDSRLARARQDAEALEEQVRAKEAERLEAHQTAETLKKQLASVVATANESQGTRICLRVTATCICNANLCSHSSLSLCFQLLNLVFSCFFFTMIFYP